MSARRCGTPSHEVIDVRLRTVQCSLTCEGRRHKVDVSDALRLPIAFVVHEEKRAVLHDWPAHSAPKLVALETRFRLCGIFKKVPRVESTVSEELIRAPVERVGPRARNGVDHASGRLAVLRRIVA